MCFLSFSFLSAGGHDCNYRELCEIPRYSLDQLVLEKYGCKIQAKLYPVSQYSCLCPQHLYISAVYLYLPFVFSVHLHSLFPPSK